MRSRLSALSRSLNKVLFWKRLHGNQKLAFYVGFAVLLIVFIPLALETFQNMTRAEAAWFNDSWQYRKSLTFTHNAAVANTKVQFDIDTTAAPDNFQADCGDVRFTDENGNLLDYYYDSAGGACDTSSTDFYVLMPSIINGENLMYMYYGNTAVANGTVASQFSQSTTSPSGGAATVGSEEKSLGPTYYWKLDEGYGTTANNSASSSAATRGTLTNMDSPGGTNSGWLTEDMCITGKCLGFDGVNDRVVSSALPATQDTTAEVWIKAGPLTTANRMILSQGGSNSSLNINWRFYLSTTGTIIFQVYRYTGAITTQSTRTYDDNKWHHIVAVISGTTTALYVDGVLVKTGTAPAYVVKTSLINIGVAPGNVFPFKGTIDDVRIYTYARSAAQIKADYNSRGGTKGTSAVLGSTNFSTLSNGLVGYWKQDEATWSGTLGEVIDSSGKSNNGQAQGATNAKAYPASPGKFGNAGMFDNVDDYVSMGDVLDITDGQDFTISGWFNAASLSDTNGIVAKRNGTNASQAGYIVKVNASGRVEFTVADGTNDYSLIGSTVTTANEWYHFVAVFDGESQSNTKIYINGVPAGINSETGTVTSIGDMSTANPFVIGAFSTGSTPFNGQIDEIRMYNRALASHEVAQLYSFAPGPIGEWQFEEGSGLVIADRSGNGNNFNANASSWGIGKFGKGWNTRNANYACAWVCNSASGDNSSDSLDFKANENFSISLWFKSNSAVNIPSSQRYLLAKGISSTAGYDIRVNASGKLLFTIDGGDGSYDDSAFGSADFYDGQWHYITAIKTGTSRIDIYVDGVLQGSDTSLVETGDLTNSRALIIGDRVGNGSASNVVDGSIDQVKIYRYALSQKQIWETMQENPIAVTASGKTLIGYWKLDEGYGTTARDSSRNGNNGILTSMSSPSTATSGWSNNGKFNKGVNMDGSDDRITTANNTAMDVTQTSEITLTGWVNFTNSSLAHRIFLKGNPFNASGTGYSLLYRADLAGKPFNLQYNDGSVAPCSSLTSGVGDITNQWNHVTLDINRNTSTWTVYLNGKNIFSGALSASCSGSWLTSSGFQLGILQGGMDEVKFYGYSLTPNDIKLDYNQGSALSLGSLGTDSDGLTASNSADRAFCPPGDTTAACGPVVVYNFEEGSGATVNDSSGNGVTGTWNGTGSRWTTGKQGKGGNFNGTDDFVNGTPVTSLNNAGSGPYSVSLWVNPAQTLPSGNNRYFMYANDSTHAMNIIQAASTGKVVFAVNNAGVVTQIVSGLALVANKWNHLEATWDGTNAVIYLNGIPSTTTITGLSPNTNTNVFWVGKGSSTFLNGKLDQVQFYNYARSGSQVAWDYNRGAPIAHWKLDECQGTSVYDSSGFGNTGAITIGASGTYTSVGSCGTSSASSAWYNGLSGKRNYSLAFDGTDQYVSFSRGAAIQSIATQGSIAGWVYYNSLDSSLRTFVDIASTGANGLIFFSNNASNKPRFSYGTASGLVSLNATRTFSTGTWYYLVGTWGSSGGKLYVDGTLEASSATAPSVTVSSGTAYIGSNIGSQRYHDGKLDDIKIFNYPLTLQQVKSLYNGGAINYGPVTGAP